jgi:two-component system, cell cycle response regulator
MSEGETVIQDFDDSWGKRAARPAAALIVLRGADLGRRYLLNERSLILGRDPKRATIVIADPTVSACHCRIDADPRSGEFTLCDLKSRNGTMVNSARVDLAPLKDGDRIFLGGTILRFAFQDEVEDNFHAQLNTLMNIDTLTGLPVKRILDLEYRKEFQRDRDEPLCVLMMDMDGLKQINDQHGHQMGAFCIAEVGKLIAKVIGEKGMMCRFGGDEFIGYLPRCTVEEAADIAEAVRAEVAAHLFQRGDVSVHPTISIGVAERTAEVKTAEELVRLADDALYRAKRAGKNAVSR